MDDLLNRTRYNNLIRPAASSAQLVSIQLQLSLAQLISVVGAGGPSGPRGWAHLWLGPGFWTRSGRSPTPFPCAYVHELLKLGARPPLCRDPLVPEHSLRLAPPPRWASPACCVPTGPTGRGTAGDGRTGLRHRKVPK